MLCIPGLDAATPGITGLENLTPGLQTDKQFKQVAFNNSYQYDNRISVTEIALFRGVYAGFHFGRGWMASAGAQAYNGGLGAVPPAGSRGRTPGGDQGGKAPLKLKAICCETP